MYIDSSKIKSLLSMKDCINEMQKLFAMNMDEDLINPLRTKMLLSKDDGNLLGMMPAYIKPYNVMGIKALSVFPNNYKNNLGSHQGIIQLFNASNGIPLATIDAEEITAIRTAAVSALVTDNLAVDDAKTLCIIGSGRQATEHLKAILLVRPIKKVHIWSNNFDNAIKFLEVSKKEYNIEFEVFNDISEAVINADIICTVTASKEALIDTKNLSGNVHINAVGACTPKSQELHIDIIKEFEVFVDSYESASNESGAIINTAKYLNVSTTELIKSDINALLNSSDDYKNRPTVFKSLGLAVEDLAASFFCYKRMMNNQQT